VLRISRTTVVLGGLAILAWGTAAALVLFQHDDVPAPIGGFVGLIAATLTIVTVQVAKRDGPAVRIEPAPLNVAVPELVPVTVGNAPRVVAVAPMPRFTPWPAAPLPSAEMGQLYRLGVIDAREDRDKRHRHNGS
jgi:hypothetical protein